MKKAKIIIPAVIVFLIACLGFLTLREYQNKSGPKEASDSSVEESHGSHMEPDQSSTSCQEEISHGQSLESESSVQEISSAPEQSSEEVTESSSESSEHEHEFVEEIIEPTCLTPGYKVFTCSICGFKHKDEEEIPALGHDYIEYVTEVSCTQDGYVLHVCSRCQDQWTDGYEPALGHNYVESERQAPSCEQDGYILYKCSRCGDSYSESLPATGHSWTKETVPATHFSPGYVLNTCQNCGSQYKTDETPQIVHTYQLTASADPTCDVDGYKTYTCSGCGDTYTDTIPATGHDWIEVSYIKNLDGSVTSFYTCSICGADKKETH